MPSELLPVEIGSAGDGTKKLATLTLRQEGRPVVVIEQELLEQIDATIDSLPHDLDGFVLASAGERAFVAGADLKAIMALTDAQLHTYLEYGAKVFQRIADMPWPTCAAIHSTTLGGGLELAMHCDGLIGYVNPEDRPFLIGLPETGLKICPGWGGTNLLPARINVPTAVLATVSGAPFKSTEAAKLGLFDSTTPQKQDVVHCARNWVIGRDTAGRAQGPSRCIQTMNTDEVESQFESIVADIEPSLHADAVIDCVRTGLKSGWQAALQAERDHLVRLRNTEPAREAIEAFFAKTNKK